MSLYIASLSRGLVTLTKNVFLYSECIFFSTLSAYLYIRCQKKFSVLLLLLAGVFSGIATTYRLFGAYVIAAMLVHIILRKKRVALQTTKLLLEFLGVTAPVLYYFGVPALRETVYYNVFERPTLAVSEMILELIRSSQYLHIIPVVLGFLGAHTLLKDRKIGATEEFLMLWVFFVLAGTLSLKQPLPEVHSTYFVLAVPALTILGGNAIHFRHSTIITILVVLSFMTLIYHAVYTLIDFEFYANQARIAEDLEKIPELAVSGPAPYAQAVAFLSGKEMLAGVVDLYVDLDISSNGRGEFINKLENSRSPS